MPAIVAVTGIVKTHAHKIFLANTHLTADHLFVEPTPMMDPEITWVVLTGMPNDEAKNKVAAPEVSAANP